ncbi:MAG: DUF6898 family protein [Geminicoccaceae bacterium]
MKSASSSDEILLELTPAGNLIRVAAIDPATLTEVIFQAPLTADRAALTALARQKLAFVMGRKRKPTHKGR